MRGDAVAQDGLGRLAFEFETDEGYATSLYWSELAAKQGNAYAQTRLATIYHEGLGVPRDPERAASWWLSAARLGHAGAQAMIGAACHLGTGIQATRVEAAVWLSLSAAQGNVLGKAYLPRVQAELTEQEHTAVRSRLQEAGSGSF